MSSTDTPDPVALAREHQKLADAATPGPWEQWTDDVTGIPTQAVSYGAGFGFVTVNPSITDDGNHGRNDAAFIAALPAIVANESRLASEVERLQGELAKLRDSHDSWRRVSERLCAERDALSAQRDADEPFVSVGRAAASLNRAECARLLRGLFAIGSQESFIRSDELAAALGKPE